MGSQTSGPTFTEEPGVCHAVSVNHLYGFVVFTSFFYYTEKQSSLQCSTTPDSQHLNHVVGVNTSAAGQTSLLGGCPCHVHHHSNLIMKKLRNGLRISWPVLPQNSEVTEDRADPSAGSQRLTVAVPRGSAARNGRGQRWSGQPDASPAAESDLWFKATWPGDGT